MNGKLGFIIGVLLSAAVMAFLIPFFHEPARPSEKLSQDCLSKTLVVKDLKRNMERLLENNRQIEREFSTLNGELEWYQQYITPLVTEYGKTVSATAKAALYIPGLKEISRTVLVVTDVSRNLSYYSTLVGSAKRENSSLHQQLGHFIEHEDHQKLPQIKEELKTYRKQTAKLIKQLEELLPPLTLAKDLKNQSQDFSASLEKTITSLFSFDEENTAAQPENNDAETSFADHIDKVHGEIERVNGLLQKGHDLSEEINMHIFILEKYGQKITLSESPAVTTQVFK